MAIGKELFDLIYSIRQEIRGKKVVSLGNPYISSVVIKKYFNINKLDLKNIELNDLSEYIFKTCFKVQSFNIIDITNEEKADFIHNLNFQINNDLINKFDLVIDPGTSEHIFDDTQRLSNTFKLLKKNGIYLFNLPSNCCLEHGFRQYSPTYFYDMCASNKGKLLLCSMGLSCTWFTLDCLPLYKRYDKYFEKVIDLEIYNNIRVFDNFGFKTGLIMRLINKLGSPMTINGLIKKKDHDINYKNVNQFIYRFYKLDEVTLNQRIVFNKSFFYKSIKEFIIIFPLPTILKIYILRIL